MNKQAFSPVISVILLLLVITVVFVSISGDVSNITQTVFNFERDTEQNIGVEILDLREDGMLYIGVNRKDRENTLTRIRLDEQDCSINSSILLLGFNKINLSNGCSKSHITSSSNLFYTIGDREYVESISSTDS